MFRPSWQLSTMQPFAYSSSLQCDGEQNQEKEKKPHDLG